MDVRFVSRPVSAGTEGSEERDQIAIPRTHRLQVDIPGGHRHRDFRAGAWRTSQVERRSEPLGALAHAGETEMTVAAASRGTPSAMPTPSSTTVTRKEPRFPAQVHPYVMRAAMLERIHERFPAELEQNVPPHRIHLSRPSLFGHMKCRARLAHVVSDATERSLQVGVG